MKVYQPTRRVKRMKKRSVGPVSMDCHEPHLLRDYESHYIIFTYSPPPSQSQSDSSFSPSFPVLIYRKRYIIHISFYFSNAVTTPYYFSYPQVTNLNIGIKVVHAAVKITFLVSIER